MRCELPFAAPPHPEPWLVSDADSSLASPAEADLDSVRRLGEAYRRIHAEVGKVIVGQQQVIEEILVAMFAGGHCLLVGVPGLAKTLLIRTLAD